MSELRWDPMLSEWVITATHRQDRTFHPPKDYCPLCPTKPGGFPTEVPAEDYEIVVFENKFPSLKSPPPEPSILGNDLYKVGQPEGICEVVLYSSDHDSSLAKASQSHITNLISVWQDRYEDLGSKDFIDYVFIFENKGEAIGVTLSHPHGQIYAFPFIPPKVQRELKSSKRYMSENNRCLFCDIIKEEISDGRRMVVETKYFAAMVPFAAHYPYEMHILPKKHLKSLSEFDEDHKKDMAKIMKTVMQKYDNLFGFSLPYLMVMHQEPTDGKNHDYYHFHIEFYPPNRTAEKLKFLAGCESGAGTFINDTHPEEKAKELRNIEPKT